jgi:hypothetical protein
MSLTLLLLTSPIGFSKTSSPGAVAQNRAIDSKGQSAVPRQAIGMHYLERLDAFFFLAVSFFTSNRRS